MLYKTKTKKPIVLDKVAGKVPLFFWETLTTFNTMYPRTKIIPIPKTSSFSGWGHGKAAVAQFIHV